MIDDILGLYSSSQLRIANDTKTVPAFITLNAFQIGEGRYIISITVFNAFLILVVIGEAIRTRGWKTLVDFNYMDPRDLVIGSSRGGQELAKAVDEMEIVVADDRQGRFGTKVQRPVDISIIQNGSRIALGPVWKNKSGEAMNGINDSDLEDVIIR
jgi:hypothetical protein